MVLVDSKQNQNYTATVRKVSGIIPIENFDRLVYAQVGVEKVLVSKDMIHKDRIVVFVPQEAALSDKYLKINNLYITYELNSNYEECKAIQEDSTLTEDEKKEKLRPMHGYFGDNGRVTLLKIRGMYSQGYLASTESIEKAYPQTAGFDWASHVDETFDFIDNDEFCHKYVVPRKQTIAVRSPKRLDFGRKDKFDYLIPGNFPTHYNTSQLRDVIQYLYPTDVVDITIKIHGTSFFAGNVKCHKKLGLWEKIKKFFGFACPETEYRKLYSTRRVVVNRREGSDSVVKHPYTECFKILEPYLNNKNMIVYGEICGYKPGTDQCIQKDHDYGCKKGEFAFMPYRVTDTDICGNLKEYEIDEVIQWTEDLIHSLPEDQKRFIKPITRVFHGRLSEIAVFGVPDGGSREEALEKWRAELYEVLSKSFGLEKDEPMCKNKVPREGIVIRKVEDCIPRAFKLKSNAHYALAKKAHDSGEADIEEDQTSEE